MCCLHKGNIIFSQGSRTQYIYLIDKYEHGDDEYDDDDHIDDNDDDVDNDDDDDDDDV